MFRSTYSTVPNRRACTFINFDKKFSPAQPYFGLHVYWFWEKISPCTFVPSYVNGLILVCMFINFERNISLYGLILFCNFPTCTFNLPYTSTDVYSVHQSTGFFWMLMKGNFDPYVIWPLEKIFALLILWGLYVAKYDIKIMMIVKYSYVSIFSCLDWKLQNWNKVLFVCMTVCSFFCPTKKNAARLNS